MTDFPAPPSLDADQSSAAPPPPNLDAKAPELQRKGLFSGVDFSDVATGAKGAPAVALSQIAATPRSFHEFGEGALQNFAPGAAAEKARVDAIAQGSDIQPGEVRYFPNKPQDKYDAETQKTIRMLSSLSQPVLPRLWREYVDPLLFGNGTPESTGIMPTQQGTYNALPESIKTNPTTPEGKQMQENLASGISGAVSLPFEGAYGVLPWLKNLPAWALKNFARTGITTTGEYAGDVVKDWQDPKNAPPGTSRENSQVVSEYAKPVISLASQILAHKAFGASGKDKAMYEAGAVVRADRENLIAKLQDNDLDVIGVRSGLTHDQVKQALRSGVPLSVLNLGGAETREALSEASGLSPHAKGLLEKYNESLTPGTAANGQEKVPVATLKSQQRLKDFFQEQAGGVPVDDAVAGRKAANKAEVDRIYKETMNAPESSSIGIPEELDNNTAIKQAQQDVEKNLNDLKTKYGYEGREVVPPQAATEGHWEYTIEGPQKIDAKPATNGNLAYWDMVKRRLWDKASEVGHNTLEGIGANNARKNLTAHLDDTVQGYKGARDEFADGVGQMDASNVGRELGAKAGSKALDKVDPETGLSRRGQLQQTVSNMTDEQRQIAKNGVYSSLADRMNSPGGVSKLSNDLLTTNLGEDLRGILGEDEFHLMRGKVLGESMVSNASPIQLRPGKGIIGSAARVGTISAAIPAIVGGITDFFMNTAFLPSHLAPLAGMATAAAAVGATRGAMTAMEARKMAEKLTPILLSKDPATIMQVSRLADKDPVFRQLVNTLAVPTRAVASQQPPINTTQRFAGGRVGRATGGRTGKDPKKKAEALIALASRIKNEQSENTSSLLNLDDTTVAKALAVANKHI